MHYRRIATFLLGLWLGGGFLMAWIAIDSFRSVDRLLAMPGPVAAVQIRDLTPGGARALLRSQAVEQNSWYFETWELMQLVLGAGFFSFLLFGSSEGKFSLLLLLIMLLIVAAQRFLMTPELSALDRTFAFIPAGAPSVDRNKFWMLHSLYIGSETLKWLLGLALGASLVFHRPARSRDAGHELDMVDKANHRHINR
jgi:hypothetical protein